MPFPTNLPSQNNSDIVLARVIEALYNVMSNTQLQGGDIIENSGSGFGTVEAASSNLKQTLDNWKGTYATVAVISSGITSNAGDFGFYAIAVKT